MYLIRNFALTIFSLLLIKNGSSEEILLQLFLRKPINIVSDKFISFNIDPIDFLELSKDSSLNLTQALSDISPSYLKISGESTKRVAIDHESFPKLGNQLRIGLSQWSELSAWIKKFNLYPIFTLPYNPKSWQPKQVIEILSMASSMGIKNCIWQLGTDFNATDSINYVDHLGTLKNLVEAFEKDGNNWSVIGVDLSPANHPEDARLYTDISQHLVEANGWIQSYGQSSLERDDNLLMHKEPVLRYLLRRRNPLWITIPADLTNTKNCNRQCLSNGLYWAETMGIAAQIGFDVVFKTIDPNDLLQPTFSYYITMIHKKLMGEKVFDTRVVNGNRLANQYYAQCTKGAIGSFTVMGINFVNTKSRVLAKMPNKYIGDKVYQYILTVDNGIVHLNGNPLRRNSTFEPVIKVKSSSRPVIFSLPAYSVGFWSFPVANLRECQEFIEMNSDSLNDESNEMIVRPKTASEVLLQQLVREVSTKTDNSESRQKRHLVIKKDSRYLNRIKRRINSKIEDTDNDLIVSTSNDEIDHNDIDQRQKRFILASFRRPIPSNSVIEDDVMLSKFYNPLRLAKRGALRNGNKRSKRQVNNALGKLFGKIDLTKPLGINMPPIFNLGPSSIPPVSTVHDVYKVDSRENIFKSLENSDLPQGDVYFDVEDNQAECEKDQQMLDVPDDVKLQKVPGKFIEYYTDMSGRQVPNVGIPTYGELWEADVYQKPPRPDADDVIRNDKIIKEPKVSKIDFVMKELEPTFKKNQENLMKSRDNMRNFYVTAKNSDSQNNGKAFGKFDSEEDPFFLPRQRRSLPMREIKDENVAAEVFDPYAESVNKRIDKLELLHKLNNILSSIENLEQLGSEENVAQYNQDLTALEELFIKKSPKVKLFKHQQRFNEDNRRKCKILAMNLEQQCNSETNLLSRRITKREAKYFNSTKDKKPTSLKKLYSKEKRASKVKRSVNVEPISWEDDGANMIHRILESDAENSFDFIVPQVSHDIPKDMQGKFDKKPVEKVAMESSENVEIIRLKIPTTSTSSIASTTTTTVATSKNDQSSESKEYHVEISKDEDSPKFMRALSKSVIKLMNIVNRHVSGWWTSL